MRRRHGAFLAGLVAVLAVLAVDCGSSSSSPTSVSAADLHQDGAFWLSLNTGLRWELARICHDEQVEKAPTYGVSILQNFATNDYVALITREYEEQGEASASDIEEACGEAKDELLQEHLGQIMSRLQRSR